MLNWIMRQRGFVLFPVVILVLIGLAIYFVYRNIQPKDDVGFPPIYLATDIPKPSAFPTMKIVPTTTPLVSKKTIRLYPAYGTDSNAEINKINIISLLFEPKDIDTLVKNEWLTNMEKVDSKIKSFFEKQFANNIEITYKIISRPIRGNQNISEYTPDSLALEAKEKTADSTKIGSYNIWMIYLVRDTEYKKI